MTSSFSSSSVSSLWLTLLLALAFGTPGCVEDDEMVDQAAEDEQVFEELEAQIADQEIPQERVTAVLEGKADRASNIFHGCTTSTLSHGTRWSYQTNYINNARQHIQVYVTAQTGRSAPRVYGPLWLSKVSTDLWKDAQGRLTVRLVNKGGGKSIRVFHNATNLLASEANGWCRTVDPVAGFDERVRVNFSREPNSLINGRWKVFSVGNELVDTDSALGFGFQIDRARDINQIQRGTMDLYRKCSPIATATYLDSVQGLNQRALDTMGNIIDAKFLVDQIVEGVRCFRNRDNLLIPVARRIEGYLWNRGANLGVLGAFRNRPHTTDGIRDFIAGCGTSDTTYYLELFTADQQHRAALTCVQLFAPNNRVGFMRLRSIDYHGLRAPSEWLTFIAD